MLQNVDDHPVSLVAGSVAIVGVYLLTPALWYTILIAGMVVSGLLEFVIKEVPPDTDEYDPEQYRLWAAADPPESSSESHEQGLKNDALATLQDRYARGDLSEIELENRVERLLESQEDDRVGKSEQEPRLEQLGR